MGRYIDAEKINIKYTFGMVNPDGVVCIPLKDVKKSIAETPTEEVEEVRHGYWIRDKESHFFHRYNCSVCNYRLIGAPTKRCEDCGAKMDRKEPE